MEVYQVQIDLGMTFETALEMYKDVLDVKPSGKVKTGFYVQRRRKICKVFLIIHAGDHGDKCIIVRPNVGRRVRTRQYIASRIRYGEYEPVSESEAKTIWDKEFVLADLPFSEYYQSGCNGRHTTHHVITGSVIPILSKMLSGLSSWDDDQQFRVVRVETQSDHKSTNVVVDIDAMEEQQKAAASNFDVIEVGLGVSYKVKSLGAVLRGLLHKQDGDKWIVEFATGRKLKLSVDQVRDGRKLFEKEVSNLINLNMPRADAVSISELAGSSSFTKIHQPILAEWDDKSKKYEMIFEEHYQDKVPNTLVGIEFSKVNMEDNLMLWESVLRNLSRKLLSEGVEPAHRLRNLEMNKFAIGN